MQEDKGSSTLSRSLFTPRVEFNIKLNIIGILREIHFLLANDVPYGSGVQKKNNGPKIEPKAEEK